MLLVPGTFSTRRFWLGPQGEGFAVALAQRGHDVWVLEPRGHGASDRPRSWTMSDWVERDAPAAVEQVLRDTGATGLTWVGHSAGGVVGAALLGARHPLAHRLRALVLLGAPGPGAMGGVRKGLAGATWLGVVALPWMRIPGRALGLGPEWEPAALVRQWMGWNVRGAWRDPRGGDYLAALPEALLPVLAVAGAGDRLLAPPRAVRDLLQRFGSSDRTLVVAGTRTGFSQDYDHAGLLIGRAARQEIWPRILDWLDQRVGRRETEPQTGTLP